MTPRAVVGFMIPGAAYYGVTGTPPIVCRVLPL